MMIYGSRGKHVVAFLASTALAACSACEGGPVTTDAGRDAGWRARRDAPIDAAWDGGPSAEWRIELTPGPGFGEACPDWEELPHPAPDAPAEGTEPAMLWEWDPMDEPRVFEALRVRGHETRGLALGPSGTIWAVAPDSTTVLALDRAGTLRWLHVLTGLDSEREFIAARGPAIAPDGSGLLVYHSPSTLVRIADDGELLSSLVLGSPLDTTAAAEVAIGPHGRVYVNDTALGPEGLEAHFLATCRGAEVIWDLRIMRSVDGGAWSVAGPDTPRVLEDGRIVAGADYTGDFWIIEEDGTAALASADPATTLAGWQYIDDISGNRVLASSDVGGDVLRTQAFDIGGGRVWEHYSTGGDIYWLHPTGTIWGYEYNGDAWEIVLYRDDLELSLGTEGYCRELPPVFTAEGGVVCAERAGDRSRLARLRADGTDAWALPVGEAESSIREIIHDVDGRIYAVVSGPASSDVYGRYGRIIAIQTDVAPPRGPHCIGRWQFTGCNRHRNDWAHDYGAP